MRAPFPQIRKIDLPSAFRVTVLLVLLLTSHLVAQDQIPGKAAVQTLSANSGHTWQVLNINNLWTWHRSDGEGNHTPTGKSGLVYPQFTAQTVYEDNLVFGGVMYVGEFPENGGTKAAIQPIRVNGGTYSSNHGMMRGWVTDMGPTAAPADTNDPAMRIYRIRRDYMEMSESELRKDASIFYELISASSATQAMMDEVRSSYHRDWQEWPVEHGAPYIERNGIPDYQAPPAFTGTFTTDSLVEGSYDEPGVGAGLGENPADQVLWTAYNGLDRARSLWFEGSEPMGLEIQKTVWGYKRTDALGNAYFTRYQVINKGGIDVGGGLKGSFFIDSMFIGQWADIDLGNATDDLLGCDSLLELGYVYNGQAIDYSYGRFNLSPPAAGYDILAGPLVPAPSDSGVFNLQRVHGKKNLGMTSFAYHVSGTPFSDPPFGDYERGTGRWWHMLRGYAPIGSIYDSPYPYPAPPGYPITKFPYSGDPVTNTGYTETSWYENFPGERRIIVSSGPFRMAPGDTQEVYVAFVAGLGADRLSSITVMKTYDRTCQEIFDVLMGIPRSPQKPKIKVTELDGEILLDWSFDQAAVKKTEETVVQPGGYLFEGYNLYQLPRSTSRIDEGVRIATYDIVNNIKTIYEYNYDVIFSPIVSSNKILQRGTDSGIERFVRLTKDYVRDIPRLYNGEEYYFAVSAYSRATLNGYVAALESNPVIVTVRPGRPFGIDLVSASGDTVIVTRTGGTSDGSVQAFVADPLAITGDTYEVRFTASAKWGVFNVTKNTWAVDTSLTNQSGDANYPVVDGMTIKAVGPPNDVKDFQHIAGPSGAITPATYAAFAFNSSGFPTPTGADRPVADWGGGQWGVHTNPDPADISFTRFKSRLFRNDNFTRFIPYDFEMRFTAGPNYAIQYYTNDLFIQVPFEIWNIGIGTPNDASDDYRMIPWLLDEDGSDSFNLQAADHTISGGTNDPYTDWIYWMDANPKTPGTAAYDAFVADSTNYPYNGYVTGTGPEVMARFVLVNFNCGIDVTDPAWPAGVNSLMPASGNTIRIISTKPNTPSDLFSINTAAYAPTQSAALAKASVNRITVFPNPYYPADSRLSNEPRRYVTFTNLPAQATIRIFNLAGQLIRTIPKNDPSQFVRWYLTNEHRWAVGSGIYICHIDLPAIGMTRVLKLAIIQSLD